jgi:hypothetical protein
MTPRRDLIGAVRTAHDPGRRLFDDDDTRWGYERRQAAELGMCV